MIIIQIAGRLGRDVETRFTPSGQKVTTLTVATNVRKGGKDETVWWRVTIWGDRYEKMMPYLKKGSAVVVVGEMSKPEIWTDKEGRPQVSLDMTAEILRFSPFGNPERQEQGGSTGASTQTTPQANQGYPQANQGHTNDSTFNEFSSASQNYSGFGQQNGHSGQSGSAYSNAQNEDPLPF